MTVDAMTHYDRLVKTGAIPSHKRDILLEATADLWYVEHVYNRFTEQSNVPNIAAPCTVRLIQELIAKGFVQLATWGEGGAHTAIQKDTDELKFLIEELNRHPFEFFLIATDFGKNWAARYRDLTNEL